MIGFYTDCYTFQKCASKCVILKTHFHGFPIFIKNVIKMDFISLLVSVRHFKHNWFPDFSVRQKKISSRKLKMDIY